VLSALAGGGPDAGDPPDLSGRIMGTSRLLDFLRRSRPHVPVHAGAPAQRQHVRPVPSDDTSLLA
jgi:hypothetical protein